LFVANYLSNELEVIDVNRIRAAMNSSKWIASKGTCIAVSGWLAAEVWSTHAVWAIKYFH